MKRINQSSAVRSSSIVVISMMLAACASSPKDEEYESKYQNATDNQPHLTVKKSYLSGDDGEFVDNSAASSQEQEASLTAPGEFKRLETLDRDDVSFSSNALDSEFSDKESVSVAANNMPLQDYVHYVFGDLLGVNYVLTPEVAKNKQRVTLSIAQPITKRRLFTLSQSILADRNVAIKHNGDVFLLESVDPNSKSSKVVGIGRGVDEVPLGAREVLQIVPVLYGIKTSLKRTVEQLSDVTVTLDARQSAVFIEGSRPSVIRAMELVQLLDSPANRGRHIGLVKLTFSTIDLYMEQMSILLENEGIPNSIGSPNTNNLVFVPLYQIGAVAIFAASDALLDRVEFWTKAIDKPSEGDVKQYFIFNPRYARATDIGQSLAPLISGAGAASQVETQARANAADAQGDSTGQLARIQRSTGAANNELTFVVDERTNSLVFYTTGTIYKGLLPLIHSLDVLPKQVMLNITIAEVTLTDEFKFGVDFALSEGKFSFSNTFGAEDIGGTVLRWVNGEDSFTAQAFKSNKLVNVLSNPSLLVRDGVAASIQVGTDIPVVGSTTTDPVNGTTRSVSYRQTGVTVEVTPTINAQGVVIMNITQQNSNEVDGGAAVEGNPQIFERSLTTEVVAESGQTIIMGGLISENVSDNDSGLPGLRDMPLVGNLFGTTTQETIKTELVILVTPRVISRTDQWDNLMNVFKNNIENIRID